MSKVTGTVGFGGIKSRFQRGILRIRVTPHYMTEIRHGM
jgi:hypothetical protein